MEGDGNPFEEAHDDTDTDCHVEHAGGIAPYISRLSLSPSGPRMKELNLNTQSSSRSFTEMQINQIRVSYQPPFKIEGNNDPFKNKPLWSKLLCSFK